MATAIASPARIAPSSQVMDSSSLSPSRPSSENGSDSSPHDHQPDRLSRSLSLSRNAEFQSSGSLRSEEYRQLFRLPSDEALVQDFNCAIQENILVQGHMYLFEHYICFYSNIFGFETKKIIQFQDVTAVRRAKTAGIFPNAIEIVAAGKKHFFASFLSRDEAFKLISDRWSQSGSGLKDLLDLQDSKSETSSLSNGVTPAENVNSFDPPVSDLDSDGRNLEAPGSENTVLPSSHEDGSTRTAASEVPDVLEENREAFIDAVPSTSSGSVKWSQDTRKAPEIPKCFTKVAETKFPISVEQFFNLFFSDDAAGFSELFHNKCGDKDLRWTSWSPFDKLGYTREKTFQHPIKIYFGAKCGGCKETHKFRVYRDSHLIIETSQEVSDVPYADYFTVEGLWDVQKYGDQMEEGCVLQVYVNVAFSKKTIWKGKIEQSTMEECREAYATWIDLAHELLKQKNIEKTEESATALALQDSQADERSTKLSGEPSEGLHRNAESGRLSDSVPKPSSTHVQIGNFLQQNWIDVTTVTSTLRAGAAQFCSFMKRHGNLQLSMVIGISVILLLMQLSIVVLLSRPQQVYVIPQADRASSGGSGGPRVTEAMHWVEKRMHLLKDEMLVVEAQLERMRREHVSLKSQLTDLERLTKQQR